jgi:cellulose synthase/poly-beta-1,6-N-acetylglucosamine synthase-like glycosyltransferase
MVSIIIPLRDDPRYLTECVNACFKQANEDRIPVEVLVLPDRPLDWNDVRVRVEATGPVSPAKKRNRGAELSHGDTLAFIDDDTRPLKGWLKSALAHFGDPKIGAVGGPSVTPKDDPYWAQVSGAVYESWMMSGGERRRYRPKEACDVEDYPSCNLIVRRSVFQDVGGFGTDYWPGEDTEFCLALVRKGHRIRYEPQAVIEHHRRPSLKSHFLQLGNYGLHRGYFVKRYPETSFRLQYFLPSIMLMAGLGLGILALLGQRWACLLLLGLAVAYFVLAILSLWQQNPRLIVPSVFGILFSHLTYGFRFLQGLLARRLPEEKA